MDKLKIFNSYNEEIKLLEKYIKELFDGKSELNILEAGCGQRWPLNLNDIKYKLTGIDTNHDALEIRKNTVKDLHVAILGDLRYLEIEKEKFDVIYSSYVLEHIDNAPLVLEKLSFWLKPRGLLILRIPDRDTVSGFVTRITPFWFHVFYKKNIQREKNAGKPGFNPYPTYYDKVVCRKGIHKFSEMYHFKIKEEYGVISYLRKKDKKTQIIRIFLIMISILSMGKLPWHYDDLTFVLEKEKL